MLKKMTSMTTITTTTTTDDNPPIPKEVVEHQIEDDIERQKKLRLVKHQITHKLSLHKILSPRPLNCDFNYCIQENCGDNDQELLINNNTCNSHCDDNNDDDNNDDDGYNNIDINC